MIISILIGILALINGVIGVFWPSFFYQSKKLTPEKNARNKRIWNRCGLGLIVLGIADLVIVMLMHYGVLST